MIFYYKVLNKLYINNIQFIYVLTSSFLVLNALKIDCIGEGLSVSFFSSSFCSASFCSASFCSVSFFSVSVCSSDLFVLNIENILLLLSLVGWAWSVGWVASLFFDPNILNTDLFVSDVTGSVTGFLLFTGLSFTGSLFTGSLFTGSLFTGLFTGLLSGSLFTGLLSGSLFTGSLFTGLFTG